MSIDLSLDRRFDIWESQTKPVTGRKGNRNGVSTGTCSKAKLNAKMKDIVMPQLPAESSPISANARLNDLDRPTVELKIKYQDSNGSGKSRSHSIHVWWMFLWRCGIWS